MSKKIKVLTLGDHPLSPSGVGTQTKYIIEALLKTEKFSVISLGGAMKHQDYTPKAVEPYGEDWKIIPIDGYGNPEVIRSLLRNEKPDILWFMTDPRFYEWLWSIENEIRPLCPMVYYHVWDNYPYPMFNKKYYESNVYGQWCVGLKCDLSVNTDDGVVHLKQIVYRIYHYCETTFFFAKKYENTEMMKLLKQHGAHS